MNKPKNELYSIVQILRKDYSIRTAVFSALSGLSNLVFLAFNTVIGFVYNSIWNKSISLYYLLLFVIRSIIILHLKIRRKSDKSVYLFTHILLLVMNLSLIVPIIIMVEGQRSYSYGLKPAIAFATYTTYRVTMAVINAIKSKKESNVFIHELRIINFTAAIVSILTLQNALIMAIDGMSEDMHTLTTYTSIFLWLITETITLASLLKYLKAKDHNPL